MTDRESFEAALQANKWDGSLHHVYADWLEEHGFDTEAAYHHQWTKERQEAEDWLRDFAEKCGMTCTNYGGRYDQYKELLEKWERGKRKGRKPTYDDVPEVEEIWKSITFEDVVQAGHDYVDHEDYLTQMGSETARDLMGNKETSDLYWKHWENFTGRKRRPPGKWGVGSAPFSCSC